MHNNEIMHMQHVKGAYGTINIIKCKCIRQLAQKWDLAYKKRNWGGTSTGRDESG